MPRTHHPVSSFLPLSLSLARARALSLAPPRTLSSLRAEGCGDSLPPLVPSQRPPRLPVRRRRRPARRRTRRRRRRRCRRRRRRCLSRKSQSRRSRVHPDRPVRPDRRPSLPLNRQSSSAGKTLGRRRRRALRVGRRVRPGRRRRLREDHLLPPLPRGRKAPGRRRKWREARSRMTRWRTTASVATKTPIMTASSTLASGGAWRCFRRGGCTTLSTDCRRTRMMGWTSTSTSVSPWKTTTTGSRSCASTARKARRSRTLTFRPPTPRCTAIRRRSGTTFRRR